MSQILNDAMDLYRYRDAIEVFEQVSSSSGDSKRVTSSATSKNFDHLIDTLKDSFKKSMGSAPDSCRGPGQSRRSSTREEKLDASLKMVDSIMDMLPISDKKRRTELQILREQIVNWMGSQSIFDRLPGEVQADIFSFLMNGSKSGILTLMLVCSTWKEIVCNTPRLWRCFDVHWRITQKMADGWLERARGIVTSLRIEDDSPFRRKQNIFRKAAKDFWSRVEELIICTSRFFRFCPEEAIRQLSVHHLVIERDCPVDDKMWDGIRKLNVSSIRTLAIDVDREDMELEWLPFSNLATLELIGRFRSAPFFELLRQNPVLETLIIVHKGNSLSYSFAEADDLAHLPLLRRVELVGCGPFNAILRSVKVPNLSVLRLEKVNDLDSVLCVDALHSQNLTLLHQFYLRGWTVSFPALLALLQSWTSLTTLKLSHCLFHDGNINSVIKALSEPASEVCEGAPLSMFCTTLQYLDLSSFWGPNVDTLLAFVKVRNKVSAATEDEAQPESTTAQIEGSQIRPLPILYLNLDGTRSVPPETVRLLRDIVPRVSCEAAKPVTPHEGNERQRWRRH